MNLENVAVCSVRFEFDVIIGVPLFTGGGGCRSKVFGWAGGD